MGAFLLFWVMQRREMLGFDGFLFGVLDGC
jgi:hypothetical protein